MPSTLDGFPKAPLSHTHTLLALKFCLIFIPLVGVKEGPKGTLPKILSYVLKIFA